MLIPILASLWLPPYDECPKFFMGQILTNKKKVLKKKDVPRSSAPKWPELALSDLWPRIQNDSAVMAYFPRFHGPQVKAPNRQFFWGILFTLRGDFCESLIDEAAEKRAAQAMKPLP